MLYLRAIPYCLTVLATVVITQKKLTEETVSFPLLAMLQEEFLFCISVWGPWCCFLLKV